MPSVPVTSEPEKDTDFRPQFTALADYYDQLMKHVPYAAWVDYLVRLFRRHHARPRRVVDLACGTGNVTYELAARGYQVVGVDLSAGMLRQARRKQAPGRSPVGFIRNDVRRLAVVGPFDAGVCLYDSLNYLLDPADLAAAFRGVRRALTPGGLFVFDLNSEHAFEAELFTQDNLRWPGDLKYLWKSRYNPTTRLCRVEMFFEVAEGAHTRRFREVHYERCYPSGEVCRLLAEANLEPVAQYEAYTFRAARPASERVFFVALAR